jgi:hypothetical protein
VLDRQYGAKPYDVPGQAARDPGVRGQPIELLELRATTGAVQSAPRNDQNYPGVKDRQIADSPYCDIVDLLHPLKAATAPHDTVGTWFQLNLDHRVNLAVLEVDFGATDFNNSVAFPASENCRKFLVGQRWVSCRSGLATGYHQAG